MDARSRLYAARALCPRADAAMRVTAARCLLKCRVATPCRRIACARMVARRDVRYRRLDMRARCVAQSLLSTSRARWNLYRAKTARAPACARTIAPRAAK